MATASCGWPITGQAPGRDCTITPTCPDRACTSPTRKLWDEVEATYRWWVDAGSPDATHSRFAVTPRWATGGIGIGWFTFGAKPRRDRHHLLPARNASSPASN